MHEYAHRFKSLPETAVTQNDDFIAHNSLRQRHDVVPPDLYGLVAVEQCLRNSLSAGMLGQTVTAVFQSWDFPDGDLPFCHAVLNP